MPIHKIYVINREELSKKSGMRQETLYILEGDLNPEKFVELFVNPRLQVYAWRAILQEKDGPIFEVRHKKNLIDPEIDSFFAAARALGESGLQSARIVRIYQFPGLTRENALSVLVSRGLFNSDAHEIADPLENIATLRPTRKKKSAELLDLRTFSDEQLLHLSAKNSWNAPLEQLQTIRRYFIEKDRPATYLEIEMFLAAWCNHCYHWVWKALGLFQKLHAAERAVNHPLVICGLGQGAAIVAFDNDTALIFKIESHNHPLFISPKEANKTGVGGVIRDILAAGQGGYPILCGNAVCTTCKEENPEGCIEPDIIVLGAVEGLAEYGNPVGVPIGEAVYKRHQNFAKPYTGVYAVGIIPKKYAQTEKPKTGDVVLLIGGRTGRDGIHGAVGSSGAITSESKDKEIATVQIGNPICERKLIDGICAVRDKDCVRVMQDLGAGGLVGVSCEIAAETGIILYLDKVPLKDTSISPREIGISESQERMLLVIPSDKLRRARKILKTYGVLNTVVGKITDTKKLEAIWRGKKVMDVDMDFLWTQCPIPNLHIQEPPWRNDSPAERIDNIGLTSLADLKERAKEILASYNISDQSSALFQFDKTVQGRTVVEPLGGKNGRMRTHISAIIPNRSERGLISTLAINPQWSHYGPAAYAERNYFEATARLTAAGADPHQIFLAANFYSPEQDAHTNWYLEKLVNRLCELELEFRIPIVNVKDSSSGTFVRKNGGKENVPITLTVPGFGFIPDVRKVITQDLKRSDSTLILVRPLGYLKGFYTNLHQLYRRDDNPILSAAVIGEGGLMSTLFEMCYGGDMGMTLNLYALGDAPRGEMLFRDRERTFVFEVSKNADLTKIHQDLGLPEMIILGKTHAEKQFFVYNTGAHSMRWNLDELAKSWESTFPLLM